MSRSCEYIQMIIEQLPFNLYSTPQYSMANDVALNLYEVQYKQPSDYQEGEEFELVNWIYEEVNMRRIIKTLQGQWTISSVQ